MSLSGRERIAFLAILVVAAGILVLHLREQRLRERILATEATLDALLEQVRKREHAERHAPRRASEVRLVSVSDRRDAWGRPLRVEPTRRIVYSVGPDGLDQQGEEDDIVRFLGSVAPDS